MCFLGLRPKEVTLVFEQSEKTKIGLQGHYLANSSRMLKPMFLLVS